jgi:hypothetical protein
MTTPASAIPLSVDYTNRDFYSLRQALIQRVKYRIASSDTLEWSGDDPADFGVALIEAFSYMGDVLSYYTDRVANEAYISTATQRDNIISIAKTYGYIPSGYSAASVTVQVTNKTASAITLYAGSQLVGDIVINDISFQIIFTTDLDLTIAANSSGTVTASHGEFIGKRLANRAATVNDVDGETLGVSNGLPNQMFTLSETTVVDNTVRIFVQNGDVYNEWLRVDHIIDAGPTDPVFSMAIDANNVHTISFGDGVSGAIPTTYAIIKADYVVGGGIIGNIPAGTLDTLQYSPGLTDAQSATLNQQITVTNTAIATGGTDPESSESIRNNAPFSLTALNRAVTLGDHATLALNADGVGKAKAFASDRNSVTLYIAPARTEGTAEDNPGMANDLVTPKTEWYNMQAATQSLMADKLQIGVTLTVSPPTYVPCSVTLQYIKTDEYTTTQVSAALKTAFLTTFAYTNNNFGDVIRPEEIENVLILVPGVTYVKVISLYRTGSTAARNVLLGSANEIFAFSDTATTVAQASNVSSLSALTVSPGTLSPTFATYFLNYTLPVPNATTSTTFAPTVTTSAASVYVNGTLYSGTAVPIATPVGTTIVPITVYAGDQQTTTTYRVSIVRTA